METISRYLPTFLLNSLWQIPLIAAVAVLACRLMRRAPAAHRHAIWVAALVVSVLLPIASVRSERQTAPWKVPEPDTTSVVSVANRATSSAHPVSPPSPAPNARTVPIGRTLAGLLAGVYLLFILYRMVQFAVAWGRTVRIRRSVLPSPASTLMDQAWTRCLREFGLSDVQLLFSENVSSPLMTGVWRKTIILPASLTAETSEDVLTTAIGHEMAHIARHDFVCNVLYELLYLPVSFHPAAWILRRSIEQTREIACDELVTQRLLDPQAYARSIVSIATGLVAAPGPDYALGVFDGDILEERIRRLVGQPVAKLRNAGLALASGLSALILCAVLASGLAIRARAQSGVQAEMTLAAAAYDQGDFKTAVQHFENASRLDPSNINTKLFLANALMQQYYRTGPPFDSSLVSATEDHYRGVIALDSHNKLAYRGMISIAMDTQKLTEGREWAMKLIELDPSDKAAYQVAGVIDWMMTFDEIRSAGQRLGIQIPDTGMRSRLRNQLLPQIEDGFRMLQIAIQLDPNYSDAMAYMNLLYRVRASLLDDPVAVADSIAKGDEWVTKTLAAKRREVMSPPRPLDGGLTDRQTAHLDVDGPPPGPAEQRLAPPPPPPPSARE